MALSTSTQPQAAAYFSLKTQFENVGDALINRELVRSVSKHVPVHVDLSRCPAEFIKTLDFAQWPNVTVQASTSKLLIMALSAQLRGRTAFYFLSPGGYFGEKKGASLVSAWINTAILWVLAASGVRICHVAVSYERIGRNHARLLRARSKLLHVHLVRDHDSAEYLGKLGIAVDGVIPDLAFADASEVIKTEANRKEVAFSFRTDQGASQSQEVARLVKLLDETVADHVPFKFVTQVERDAPGMRRLAQMIKTRPVSTVDGSRDIEQCRSAYATCSHIVSNRLHALIIGSLAGAAPVATINAENNAKVVGLFKSMSLEGNIFYLSEHGAVAVAKAIGGPQLRTIDTMHQRTVLERCFADLISGKLTKV